MRGRCTRLLQPELTSGRLRATFLAMNAPERPNKFKAYRARKKAAGLREVRFWVPDVHTKEFWEASVREAEILRNAPEEEETERFFDALHAEDPDCWD